MGDFVTQKHTWVPLFSVQKTGWVGNWDTAKTDTTYLDLRDYNAVIYVLQVSNIVGATPTIQAQIIPIDSFGVEFNLFFGKTLNAPGFDYTYLAPGGPNGANYLVGPQAKFAIVNNATIDFKFSVWGIL